MTGTSATNLLCFHGITAVARPEVYILGVCGSTKTPLPHDSTLLGETGPGPSHISTRVGVSVRLDPLILGPHAHWKLTCCDVGESPRFDAVAG